MQNIRELKKKLLGLAEGTIDSPRLGLEFNHLFRKLTVKREDVLKGVLEYTFSTDLTNEFFDSMAARFVLHLHHYIPGTYHEKRQAEVGKFLEGFSGTAIDVGFGVPGPYIFKTLRNNDRTRIILADKNTTAFKFFKRVI